MHNKLFLFLGMFGILFYSFAENGEIHFSFWPKFLKETLPNSTISPYLAPPEPQQEDHKSSPLACLPEEWVHPNFYFLQAKVPLTDERGKKESGYKEAVIGERKKAKKKMKREEAKNLSLETDKKRKEEERKRKETEKMKHLLLTAYKKIKEEEIKRKEAEKKARVEKLKRLFLLGADKKKKEEELKRKEEAERKRKVEEAERKRKEREEEGKRKIEEEECKWKEKEEEKAEVEESDGEASDSLLSSYEDEDEKWKKILEALEASSLSTSFDSVSGTPPRFAMWMPFEEPREEPRTVDMTKFLMMKDFVEERNRGLEAEISSHRQALQSIEESMRALQERDHPLLDKAKESISECEQRNEGNSTKQRRLGSEIQAQNTQADSLQARINELSGLLKESFFRLKESLGQQNEALQKEFQQSEGAYEAWKQKCVEQHILRQELSTCEESLKETEHEIKYVEHCIQENDGKFFVIYTELHNTLAERVQGLVQAILANSAQDFWPIFDGFLKEKAEMALPKPPSQADIDKKLKVYLDRLILLPCSERSQSFVGFLDAIHWTEYTAKLGSALEGIVEADKILQHDRLRKEELGGIYAHHEQQHKGIKEKLDGYGLGLEGLRGEEKKYLSAITQKKEEKAAFLKSYQFVLDSEKLLAAPRAGEWEAILSVIPACDEKETFLGCLRNLEASETELKDIMGEILQGQKKLESLKVKGINIEESLVQAERAHSEREQIFYGAWTLLEERKNEEQQIIQACQADQENLKNIVGTLSVLITSVSKAYLPSQYDQVSSKLHEEFQGLERNFAPEGPLRILAVPYEEWKETHG